MAPRTDAAILNPDIAAYIAARTPPPDEVQQRLIARTAEATGGAARMQIGSDQGTLLQLLVRLVGARRAVGGRHVHRLLGAVHRPRARARRPAHVLRRQRGVDVDRPREAWDEAGVADRIDLRIAPAIETLRALPDEPIDFVFIDADKGGYLDYFEAVLPKVRPNGIILADNTLWSGRVLHVKGEAEGDTIAIQRFNDRVAGDQRVDSYILPVGDGVTLIRKR